MPSKYSHSLVLAQHSSTGLIRLPNDQYTEYVRTSPLLTAEEDLETPLTAPSFKNRSRAASTKTNLSFCLAAQNNIRQQSSFDQLAAGAYQIRPSDGRVRGRLRQVIVDSDEEDDDETPSAQSQPEAAGKSNATSSASPKAMDSRRARLPPRLPIGVQTPMLRNGAPSSNLRSPLRAEQKPSPQTTPFPEVEVGPPMELRVQRPRDSNVLAAPNCVPADHTYTRVVSTSKSLATPQLSPSLTERTRLEDSPPTPFSSLQRGSTPTMLDEQRNSLSRERSGLSEDSETIRPEPMRLPSQADFDDFWEDAGSGGTYFKDMPEPAEAREVRLRNLRVYNAMERAINASDQAEESNFDRSPPAVPRRKMRQPRPKTIYPARVESVSSLSSLSEYSRPGVSQSTGRPQTSAGAIKNDFHHEAHEALPRAAASNKRPTTSASNKARQASASAKTKLPLSASAVAALSKASSQSQMRSTESLLPPPSVQDSTSSFRRQFDPDVFDLLPSEQTALTRLLRRLDSRFSNNDEDEDEDSAAPPPNIARHPVHIDPLSELVIDSKGGVTTLAGQGHQRQRSRSFGNVADIKQQEKRGGLFSSWKLKARKR